MPASEVAGDAIPIEKAWTELRGSYLLGMEMGIPECAIVNGGTYWVDTEKRGPPGSRNALGKEDRENSSCLAANWTIV